MIYFTSDLHLKCECIRRFDVGVDANGYYPVAITTVLDFVEKFR